MKMEVNKSILFTLLTLFLVFHSCSGPSDPSSPPVVYTPEIILKTNYDNINNDGILYLNQQLVGTRNSIEIQILNNGNSSLELTSDPFIKYEGSTEISITQPNLNVISPSNITTFLIVFSPTSLGEKQGKITISSNDKNRPLFEFTVVGNTTPEPIIEIHSGSFIPSRGRFYMGIVTYGNSSAPIDFTIKNTGTSELILSGNPYVSLSGINSDQFAITAMPLTGSIAPGGSEKFSIIFSPTTNGNKYAEIKIANNDAKNNYYTIYLKGSASYKPVPAMPDLLTATIVSNSSIDLAWRDNSTNEDGFTIERKIGALGAFLTLTNVTSGTERFSDTGLIDGTEYFYRVRSYHNDGYSVFSNVDSAITTLPAPSMLNVANTTSSTVELSWTDNSNNEFNFLLERKEGFSGVYSAVSEIPSNQTSFIDSGLKYNTVYYYRLKAKNLSTESQYSNETNGTTKQITPAVPSGLSVNMVTPTNVNLNWIDNSDNEVSYVIERKVGLTGIYAELGTVGANVTFYSDLGITRGNKYFYRVKAVNAIGSSNYSQEIEFISPLAIPTNLIITNRTTRNVTFTWNPVENATGYKIYYGDLNYIYVETVTGTIYTTPDNLSALRYTIYSISAINDNCESEKSDPLWVIALLNPLILSLTSDSYGTVQIDTNYSSPDIEFKYYRSTSYGGPYVSLNNLIDGNRDTNLSASTTYFYKAEAIHRKTNRQNPNSPFIETFTSESDVFSITTPYEQLYTLNSTNITATSLTLNWVEYLGAREYIIERSWSRNGGWFNVNPYGVIRTNTYTDRDLDPSERYYYKITAIVEDNVSVSNIIEVKTNPRPQTPSYITARSSNSGIVVSWDYVNGVDGYYLYRRTSSNSSWTKIRTISPTISPGYIDDSVFSGIPYFYCVSSFDANGTSLQSSQASAIKPLPPW